MHPCNSKAKMPAPVSVASPVHHSRLLAGALRTARGCKVARLGRLREQLAGSDTSRIIATNASGGERRNNDGHAGNMPGAHRPGEDVSTQMQDCVGTGMDVTCNTPQDDGKSGLLVDASSPAEATAAIALLISPFFFWGTSMVAMKSLGESLSPFLVGSFRLIPAGMLVVAFAASQGRKMPESFQAWRAVLLFGLVDAAAFQGCLAEGLLRTTAGLGSVIIDSQPLTVAVLASVFLGERLGVRGGLGLLSGVAGLLLLEVPEGLVEKLLTGNTSVLDLPQALPWLSSESLLQGDDAARAVEAFHPTESGELWMLLAAQAMAVGTVMVPWVSRFVDPVQATGWHMILGGIPLLCLAVMDLGWDGVLGQIETLSASDWAVMLYVSALGGAAGYGVFFYNASKGNLTTLSSLTFLTPVFAAGAGFLLLGETLNAMQILGATVTLGAVYFINSRDTDEKA